MVFSQPLQGLLGEKFPIEDLDLGVKGFDSVRLGARVAMGKQYAFEQVEEGEAKVLLVDKLIVFLGHVLQKGSVSLVLLILLLLLLFTC